MSVQSSASSTETELSRLSSDENRLSAQMHTLGGFSHKHAPQHANIHGIFMLNTGFKIQHFMNAK